MATTVHVKGIAPETGDKEVKDFFSFCGKIKSIDIKSAGEGKEADVTFEKETAAKTALLLNNSQLGKQNITVTSASGDSDDDGSHYKSNETRDSDEITQEEKPRSRILAEYLAHGYVIGDATLQRAIELDSKHGVSQRFLATLQNLDAKYHATDKAKATDQSYGITAKANSLLSGIGSYFEKATGTPTGQRIVQFYTEGTRQVTDVHNEARRLAELKKQAHGGSAYKASGLERVFGKEEEKPEGATSTSTSTEAAPAAAPASGTSPVVADTTTPKV